MTHGRQTRSSSSRAMRHIVFALTFSSAWPRRSCCQNGLETPLNQFTQPRKASAGRTIPAVDEGCRKRKSAGRDSRNNRREVMTEWRRSRCLEGGTTTSCTKTCKPRQDYSNDAKDTSGKTISSYRP